MSSGRLDGKVALVTGASAGIGAATARALAVAGAKVAIGARRKDRLDGLVKEITGKGGQALAIEADIRKRSDAEAMVQKASKWGGRLDILINNAGTSPLALVENSQADDLQLMLDTNLAGLIYATRAAIPELRRAGGDIVNVAGVSVRVQNPGSAVYAATKAGVAAFSESLRKELMKYNIRVSVINPGLVKTEISATIADPTIREATIKRVTTELVPLSAEDMAELILFVVTRPPNVAINDVLIRPTQQV